MPLMRQLAAAISLFRHAAAVYAPPMLLMLMPLSLLAFRRLRFRAAATLMLLPCRCRHVSPLSLIMPFYAITPSLSAFC
jgi:hypothetical protein